MNQRTEAYIIVQEVGQWKIKFINVLILDNNTCYKDNKTS